MGRVEFITAVGSSMFVDESRVDEYKAAGFKLAASVLETQAKEEAPVAKKTRKKKEV